MGCKGSHDVVLYDAGGVQRCGIDFSKIMVCFLDICLLEELYDF